MNYISEVVFNTNFLQKQTNKQTEKRFLYFFLLYWAFKFRNFET